MKRAPFWSWNVLYHKSVSSSRAIGLLTSPRRKTKTFLVSSLAFQTIVTSTSRSLPGNSSTIGAPRSLISFQNLSSASRSPDLIRSRRAARRGLNSRSSTCCAPVSWANEFPDCVCALVRVKEGAKPAFNINSVNRPFMILGKLRLCMVDPQLLTVWFFVSASDDEQACQDSDKAQLGQ